MRRGIADTAAVAAMLGCTPGKVRLLVHRGVLHPVGREKQGGRGQPRLLFDLREVRRAIPYEEPDERG